MEDNSIVAEDFHKVLAKEYKNMEPPLASKVYQFVQTYR